MWGNMDHGKMARGGEADAPIFEEMQLKPVKVAEPPLQREEIKQVALGGAHNLVVTADGNLLSCGLGEHGQLGRGDEENYGILEEALIENVSPLASSLPTPSPPPPADPSPPTLILTPASPPSPPFFSCEP